MSKKNRKKSTRPAAEKIAVTRQHPVKRKSFLPWLLAAMGITVVCFFPILKNDFTNWDDEYYVVNNMMLRGPDWQAIFTQSVAANYHPLTMITLAINYQIGGLNPFSYLLVNLLFHLANTVLVFYFIYTISSKKKEVAFLTALIFGIHPMHVESVAWIAERKDVLYTFFFLLSLLQYWQYLVTGKRMRLWVCLILFIFSLLSKPAAIILPLVLFLLDYWKGRRINLKLSVEKIPFFVLAILFAVITLKIQSPTAMAGLNVFPFWTRLFFASYGIMIYFFRFFIPYPLSSFHPFPAAQDLGWPVFLSPLFIIVLLVFLWYQRKNKVVIFGFLFFVVNLLLVLQVISVGLTIVSERYTYVPYIGLAFMVGTYLNQNKEIITKQLVWLIPAVITLVFGFISFRQATVWKNSGSLWTNVISHYPNSPYARTNRANYSFKLTQTPDFKTKTDSLYKQVLEDCSIALSVDPKHIPGYQNRINIFLIRNQNQEALRDAESLTRLDSNNPAGYLTKGIVYTRLNDTQNAINNLNRCLSLDSNADVALNMRATLLVNNFQKFSEALVDFNRAISLNPNGEYFLNRSICYYRLGDIPHAKADAETALQKGVIIADSYRRLLNL